MEDGFAVGAIGDGAVFRVAGGIEAGLGAIGKLDGRPGNVGVREDAVDRAWGVGHHAGGGEHALGLCAQDVLGAAEGFLNGELVLLNEGLDAGLTERDQLGIEPAHLLAELGAEHVEFLGALKGGADLLVLVEGVAGVAAHAVQVLAEAVEQVEGLFEGLGVVAEVTLEGDQLGQLRAQFGPGSLEGGFILVDQGEVPVIGGVDGFCRTFFG